MILYCPGEGLVGMFVMIKENSSLEYSAPMSFSVCLPRLVLALGTRNCSISYCADVCHFSVKQGIR